MKKQLSFGATFWYVVINIATLGSFYFIKITIMKAIIDAHNAENVVTDVYPAMTPQTAPRPKIV